MNIGTFINWFITQVINIMQETIDILDSIYITNNVSILDFILAIIIIGAFLTIILTIPQTASGIERRAENRERAKKVANAKKEYWERKK